MALITDPNNPNLYKLSQLQMWKEELILTLGGLRALKVVAGDINAWTRVHNKTEDQLDTVSAFEQLFIRKKNPHD